MAFSRILCFLCEFKNVLLLNNVGPCRQATYLDKRVVPETGAKLDDFRLLVRQRLDVTPDFEAAGSARFAILSTSNMYMYTNSA